MSSSSHVLHCRSATPFAWLLLLLLAGAVAAALAVGARLPERPAAPDAAFRSEVLARPAPSPAVTPALTVAVPRHGAPPSVHSLAARRPATVRGAARRLAARRAATPDPIVADTLPDDAAAAGMTTRATSRPDEEIQR